MLSRTLFIKELRANYKLLLLFMAVLTMYASMITVMFDPKLGDSLKAMMESMPQVFAMVGMENPGTTLGEFFANYLYSFLLVIFPLVFIAVLSNRLVVRYVDQGSMAYLLATPNKRRKIIATQAAGMLWPVLVLVVYVTAVCVALGGALFPGELDVGGFILVNVGLFGLLLFLAGVCFCSSCIFNRSQFATGVGVGLCILFVLLQMISQAGDKFEVLKYATPLTLFDAGGILAGESAAIGSFGVLYGMGIVLFGVGMAIFCKRDIPV